MYKLLRASSSRYVLFRKLAPQLDSPVSPCRSQCAYSRAVGELAPDEEISSLLKVTLDNTVTGGLPSCLSISLPIRSSVRCSLGSRSDHRACDSLEAALRFRADPRCHYASYLGLGSCTRARGEDTERRRSLALVSARSHQRRSLRASQGWRTDSSAYCEAHRSRTQA